MKIGSEDKTVRVWGLTLGLLVSTFRHQAPVTAVTSMFDGRRIVSSDRAGTIRVWAADTGTLIQSVCGPGRCFTVSSDMRYGIVAIINKFRYFTEICFLVLILNISRVFYNTNSLFVSIFPTMIVI